MGEIPAECARQRARLARIGLRDRIGLRAEPGQALNMNVGGTLFQAKKDSVLIRPRDGIR
jgi:hypothetical protein